MPVRIRYDHSPHNDVTMPVHVLREGVEDEVGPECERVLVEGRGKLIIHE